ncbi:hypothetical protein [Streptomyces anulatus]|uniref:hypothetical protein n=1 Tax=Streptomyces anulatus TaxID=1892 RepID=UPI0033E6D08F
MFPASDLLKLIKEKAQDPTAESVVTEGSAILILDQHPAPVLPAGTPGTIFDIEPRTRPRGTRIDVNALEEGDQQAARSRHGRGQGVLLSAHVMALLDLDGHQSLQVLGERQADRFRESALHADVDFRSRAEAYLERIGEDEAERRADAAASPSIFEHPREDCPVCCYETFQVDGYDLWGRVGHGQCLVCAYARSPDAADDEGFAAHLASLDSSPAPTCPRVQHKAVAEAQPGSPSPGRGDGNR